MPTHHNKKYGTLFNEVTNGRNIMFHKLYNAMLRGPSTSGSALKSKTYDLRKTDSNTDNCLLCKHLVIDTKNPKKQTYACAFISKENQKMGYLRNDQLFVLSKPPKELVCDKFEAGGDPNNIKRV